MVNCKQHASPSHEPRCIICIKPSAEWQHGSKLRGPLDEMEPHQIFVALFDNAEKTLPPIFSGAKMNHRPFY